MQDTKFTMNAFLLVVIILSAVFFFFTVKVVALSDHSAVNDSIRSKAPDWPYVTPLWFRTGSTRATKPTAFCGWRGTSGTTGALRCRETPSS